MVCTGKPFNFTCTFCYIKKISIIFFHRFVPSFLRIFHRFFSHTLSFLLCALIFHSLKMIVSLYSRDCSLFCSVFSLDFSVRNTSRPVNWSVPSGTSTGTPGVFITLLAPSREMEASRIPRSTNYV